MKIHFLGSAASEGVPNPFCHCKYCQQARLRKGKDLRTRSSAIIDEEILIDVAPEFSQQLLRDDMDATNIKDLLFTHTHPDHFNVGDLFSRMEGFGFDIHHPLHIYGNDRAINGAAEVLPGFSAERFAFHCLPPFITVESRGYRFTPLLTNHAKWELCYGWFIENAGKTIFYGHDSGWFPEQTWQWLEGKKIDICVLECTYGFNGNDRTDNHMSLETVFAARNRLHESSCLHENSRVVVSHVSHSGGLLHDELVSVCAKENILVAWDGLTIDSKD